MNTQTHTVLKTLFSLGLHLVIVSTSIAGTQMTQTGVKFPDGSEQTTALETTATGEIISKTNLILKKDIRFEGIDDEGNLKTNTFFQAKQHKWGMGVSIGSGGTMILGSGESSGTLWRKKLDPEDTDIGTIWSEDLYLASDQGVKFVTGIQDGYQDNKTSYLRPNGDMDFAGSTVRANGKELATKEYVDLSSASSNILDPHLPFTVGSGSDPWWGSNNPAESFREVGETPFSRGVVMVARNLSTANDSDGGWNSQRFAIDSSKRYRYSVYAKQSSHSGTIYWGTHGYGGSQGTLNNLNGSSQNNPYAFAADLPTINTWYLIVGYVYESGYTGTSNHPDHGVWDLTTGNKVSGYGRADFKWHPENNEANTRAYQYYNATSSQDEYHFWQPRFEEVNGEEPTISELTRYVNSASGGVPSGTIVMWSGSNVPSGWAICNGSNGTPNLTGRFIKAATTAGSTGGSNTHSHGHTLQGGAHTLTVAQMPSHSHQLDYDFFKMSRGGSYDNSFKSYYGSLVQHERYASPPPLSNAGGNSPHTHPVSGSINSGSNQPEYYSLLFIMKL